MRLSTTILALSAALAGCSGPDAGPGHHPRVGSPSGTPTGSLGSGTPVGTPPSSATLVQGGLQTCADPSLRATGWWDRTELPAQFEAESRLDGGALAIADFDGDGRVDLFTPSSTSVQLWFQGADGGWEDRSATAIGAIDLMEAAGAAVADYDADGDLDLFVARYQLPDVLLRNDGGVFTDVSAAVGLSTQNSWALGGTWADWDRDGDLDLAVAVYSRNQANRFYTNNGDGTFHDSGALLPDSQKNGLTFHMAFHDLDNNGIPELFVANDHFDNGADCALFAWEGSRFVEDLAAGYHPNFDGMGQVIADFDGDLIPDIAETTWKDVGMLLGFPVAGPMAGMVFVDNATVMGLKKDWIGNNQRFSWGIDAGDLDNDGDLDLGVTWGHWESGNFQRYTQPDSLLLLEDGVFVEQPPVDYGAGRAMLFADLNGDGWLDSVKRQLKDPTLVDVQRCGAEHWLTVAVHDVEDSMNRFGIGTSIVIEAGGQRWIRWIDAGSRSLYTGGPPEVHVGLADLAQVDALTVTWPDGRVAEFRDFPANQRVTVEMLEGPGGD